MATKTYQTIHIHFSGIFHTVNGAKRITFAGSTNNSRGIYTTADTAEQEAIESSQKYHDKEIYLFREYDDKEPEAVAEEPVVVEPTKEPSEPAAGENSFPEVTNVQTAAKILRDKFGAKPETVNNKVNVLAKAAELGVEFPNLPK